ncbi:MAG: DoxX family membrane protein [Anaerolineae bacterium]|nr:DoxX family membrane protein [Anaerolineae bacterium]
MNYALMFDAALILGRFIVGGLLVLAGLLKLKAGPRWFLRQILAYEVVKGRTAWLLARGLPWAEIVCGVLLMAGLLTPLAAVATFVLLWAFTAVVISTFWRGKPVDCGCFGHRTHPQTQKARWTIVYRNLILMGLLVAIYGYPPPLSVDAWLNSPLYQPDNSILAAAWLVLFWLALLFAAVALQWWVYRQGNGRHLSQATSASQRQ